MLEDDKLILASHNTSFFSASEEIGRETTHEENGKIAGRCARGKTAVHIGLRYKFRRLTSRAGCKPSREGRWRCCNSRRRSGRRGGGRCGSKSTRI